MKVVSALFKEVKAIYFYEKVVSYFFKVKPFALLSLLKIFSKQTILNINFKQL